MLHSLGFNFVDIPRFVDENGVLRKKPLGLEKIGDYWVSTIKTPKILELTRRHFGCENITSVPFENEGGEGTARGHWERVLFYDELMTGSSIII